MRVGIAQVPHEAIQACLGLEGVRRLLGAAREPAHQRVARVEEVECRLLLGLLLHVEVHGRAVRRVGPEPREAARRHEAGAPESHGVTRGEEVPVGVGYLVRQLFEGSDVVQHPERAPVRRRGEIVVLEREIVNRRDGQVELQGLPARAVVERHVHPELGTGEQQPAARGILAHHAHEMRLGNPGHDLLPGAAVIARLVHVGPEVVELVARRRHIGRRRVLRRWFHGAHQTPLGQLLGRDVLPRLPAVTRHLHEAVVGAGPDHARVP